MANGDPPPLHSRTDSASNALPLVQAGGRLERDAVCRLDNLLNAAAPAMRTPKNVATAFPQFVVALESIRKAVPADQWLDKLVERCQSHPIAELLLEDPYTERAFRKPRGFAGDAVMLDFVYDRNPPATASDVGKALFAATTGSDSAQSVRDRRDRLARLLEDTVRTRSGAVSVASIACGHLRELSQLEPRLLDRFAVIHAVDQDESALEVVAKRYSSPVRPIRGSVRDIIAGRLVLANIDLIYAAGLFDYLSDAVSARLIDRMLTSLAPGGRLLVGNFTPFNSGRAYMDAFMDWQLTYRSAADLREIGRIGARRHRLAVEKASTDAHGNVAYLELVKA